jgi:hypothetical protein
MGMKKYEVQVAETRVQIYIVKAQSETSAYNKVHSQHIDAELRKDECVEWYINEVEEVK